VPRAGALRQPWQGERLGFWWGLSIAVLYLPAGLIAGLRYCDADRIPKRGPAILVVNHVSHVDPLLVARLVIDAGRVPHVLAKESLFAVPVVGTAMRQMGHIPVRRGTLDARASLEQAVAALRRGELVVLHPEGTVTRDPQGWPMVARSGAARLALLAPDVPVIPIGQWGIQTSYDLYRKRIRPLPRPRHTFSVGKPIDTSAFTGAEATRQTLTAMTDQMMRAVRQQVAVARDMPAPTGELYRWVRPPDRAEG
jgi:1-acyl-sn-glycerol-3-phosphate acyltransferase